MLKSQKIFVSLIFAGGLILLAKAATAQPKFPVASLGNCASQSACHAYCDQPAHMPDCVAYAKANGLISQIQADQADQYAQILASGSGPGGCKSADACEAFCTKIVNLKTCIAFAQTHSFVNDDITTGEKVLSYLESGGHMPGNCGSKDSCMAYCGQTDHEQECRQVFTAAHIMGPGQENPNQPAESFPPEELQKFAALLQSGQTPGGCQDLQACLDFCKNPSQGQACGAFAQAMGFGQNNSNAQVQNNQPGPGGCTDQASCQTYCSDPSHTQECKTFFQKAGTWVENSGTTTQTQTSGTPPPQ
ncbi:MAG: hypothetical protein KGJ93_03735 [Patescibacteria group bacterium]|nr:hypothetical protein [Patescibacteria group bacterium]